ncbi:MAG: SPFH domain-containing protein [Clostridia bacterium]|nr:SPFH domain-containing protein [Clostridia bacterium]
MGLLRAAAGAISGTLKDQWKEAIRCEDLGNEILMKKVTTSTGVITNKSTIIVGPGQCAIIYDNGKVIDATAEEGYYVFDESSSPSFFAGQFGKVFKEMWERFTYNGASAKQQAVFFFNTKEITDNRFGTQNPIPFPDWTRSINNRINGREIPLSLQIRVHGTYSFKISNPAVFMREISGTADIFYKKDLVEGQMREEVVSVLQNVLNELGARGSKLPVNERIAFDELPSQTDEMEEMMNEKVYDDRIRERGLSIVKFVISTPTPTEESLKDIKDYEKAANVNLLQGQAISDYGEAMKNAGSNAGGAMNGFIGVGMMNNATNGVMSGAVNNIWNQQQEPQQPQQPQATPQPAAVVAEPTSEDNSWECPNCHTKANGKFCPECGTKKPEAPEKRVCPECGKELSPNAKFCPECGTKID